MPKKKPEPINVFIVLDRTGSMAPTQVETVEGLHAFIQDQDPGASISLAQFDSYPGEPTLQSVYEDRGPRDIPKYTQYQPRGMTPLWDAVGASLTRLAERDPKGKVVVLIVTDGEENASREWSLDKVNAAVLDARAKGWEIVFMGADIDAWGVGGFIGMAAGSTMAYAGTSAGTKAAWGQVTNSVRGYASGQTVSVETPQEKVTGVEVASGKKKK